MAWIESHQELRDHPKTRRLARMLGINVAQAIGHLHMLWWWAMDYAPDGDLTDFDAYDIAEAAGWDGDPEALLDALLQCGPGASFGFLERMPDGRLVLHDWDEYNNEHKLRQAAAERKRRSRQRRMAQDGHSDVTTESRDMRVTVTGQLRDGHTDVTLDRTGPDQTRQDNDVDDAGARDGGESGHPPSHQTARLGPVIGGTPVDPPEALQRISQAWFAVAGKPLIPGDDVLAVKEALAIATEDQVLRAIDRAAQQFRPKYAGDRISSFRYVLPVVRKIVAEDEALADIAKMARASPDRSTGRDLSFLDEGEGA